MTTPQKITLQYKCRRCGKMFYDPSITYLQKVEHIRMTPALMITIHQCEYETGKRFGICDLVGCKVEGI
jgi:hypothetical protein